MKIFQLFGVTLLSGLFLVSTARGQGDGRKAYIQVTAHGATNGHLYNLHAQDETSSSISIDPNSDIDLPLVVMPGKIYSMTLAWTSTDIIGDPSSGAVSVNLKAPPGFTVLVNTGDIATPCVASHLMSAGASIRDSSSLPAVCSFQVVEDSAFAPAPAGRISRLDVSDFVLDFGLGTLDNGKSAGRIQLRTDGRPTSTTYGLPSSVFLGTSLCITAPGSAGLNWVVTGGSGNLEVDTTQVRAAWVASSSTHYTLSFYAGNGAGTYNSTAFATYTIEKITSDFPSNAPSGADCMKITETQGSLSPLYHYIFRSTSTDVWTLIEGAGGEQRIEEHTSTTVSGNRQETILVKNSTPTVVTKTRRTWAPYSSTELLSLDEVWSVTTATDADLTTTYTYFMPGDSPTPGAGSVGKLKQVTHPDGSYSSFTYYDDNDQLGQVKTVTEPWSVSTSSVLSKVTTYLYTGPTSALKEYPSSAETKIDGTTTAKTTYEYDFELSSPDTPARSLVKQTTTSFAGASSTLTTETISYSKDDGDFIFTGRPYSIKYPDGRQQAFRYEHGTYSSGTFTAGTGTAWRTWIVEGSHTGGTATTSISGLTFESIGLVSNLSTLTEVIRNGDDAIVSQKTYVWDGSGFDTNPISTTTNTWTDSVRQHTSTALNGVVQTWNWDGAYLANAIDGTGVKLTYTYDCLGRVSTKAKEGVAASGSLPAQAPQTITYTYDTVGRVLTEQLSDGTHNSTTTYVYDDAGRIKSTTLPGNETTSVVYSFISGGSQTVATLPNTGTVTTKTLLDGKTMEITGATGTDKFFSYTIESDGRISSLVTLGAIDSTRWQSSKTDWLGRTAETRQPGFTGEDDRVTTNTYDETTGLLVKIARTGLADELRIYGSMGQLTRAGLDVTANGTLDPADAKDRVTDYSDSMFVKLSSDWWALAEEKIYPTATELVTGKKFTRLTGWSGGMIAETKQEGRFGSTTAVDTVVTLDTSTKQVTTTTRYPKVTNPTISIAVNGLPTQTTSPDGRTVTVTYDGLGRSVTSEDSRTGTTTYEYRVNGSNETGQVHTVTDPAGAVTTYTYDDGGRAKSVKNDINAYAYYDYDTANRMTKQWGGAVTPVEYEYDGFGQVHKQHTFQSTEIDWASDTWPTSDPGDVTIMTYDEPSGLLTKKEDAAGHSVDYTYNERGQVATRLWARTYYGNRVSTSYDYYSGTGELHTLTYNDGTPTATYVYDRMGLMKSAADIDNGTSIETRTFEYDDNQQLKTGKNPAYLGNRWLTYTYEADASGKLEGRASGYEVGVSGALDQDLTTFYAYDATGRIDSLTATQYGISGSRTFNYGYVSGSSLLNGLSGSTGTGCTYTQIRAYDPYRDLLSQFATQFTVSSTTTTKSQYDYTFNSLGQRKTAKQSGEVYSDFGASTFYKYTYNNRGEVDFATGFLCVSDDVVDETKPLPGRDYKFTYDSIGNRVTATNSSFLDYFYTNNLNQITSRDNHKITVSGTLAADAKILVNGALADRQGPYWSADVALNNSGGPAYNAEIPLRVGKAGSPDKKQITSVPGFIAPASEGSSYISYDDDGNLTSDARWTYKWDAENRLTSMQTTSASIGAGLPGRRLEFRYDSTGRRTSKKVSTWSGSAWTFSSDVRFVYQGWNLVAELTANSSGSVTGLARTYAWGLDMAGSLSATGGVGALVQMVDNTGTAAAYLPSFDGSGNVVTLMKSDGTIAATYEYGPFGELLRKDGDYAALNPMRNATKYTDNESSYVYYGTRYYDPRNGRFVSRDTIGEAGGLNLYGFVGNNPINAIDVLGRDAFMVIADNPCPNGAPMWFQGDGMDGQDHRNADIASANKAAFAIWAAHLFDAYDAAMANLLAANRLIKAIKAGKITNTKGHVSIAGSTNTQQSLIEDFQAVIRADQLGYNLIAQRIEQINAPAIASAIATFNSGFTFADGFPQSDSVIGYSKDAERGLAAQSALHSGLQLINLKDAGISRSFWDSYAPGGGGNAGSRNFFAASERYTSDAMQQIGVASNTDLLLSLSGRDSVLSTAIFCHGSSGGCGFGTHNLTDDQWLALGNTTAAIYILGCAFSANDGFGEAQRIATLTGRTVYASPFVVEYLPNGRIRSAVITGTNTLGPAPTAPISDPDTVYVYVFTPTHVKTP